MRPPILLVLLTSVIVSTTSSATSKKKMEKGVTVQSRQARDSCGSSCWTADRGGATKAEGERFENVTLRPTRASNGFGN
jgi:hypothetical protein